MTFFWCKFGFGKCFGASFWSSHWACHCQLSYKIHFWSHVTVWSGNGPLCRVREDNTSKWRFLKIFSQLMKHQFIELFRLFSLLQRLNGCRLVHIEFFGNFLCSCKGSASMIALSWSLPTFNGWPLCASSSSLSSPLQNFLNYYYTVCSLAVPGTNALFVLWVVSGLLYNSFWIQIRKSFKFPFCLTSLS